MNQVASSLSENRRRRERQIHTLLRRLEAENEALASIESSNTPLPDSEEEPMDLEDSVYINEEDVDMTILQCPTLICTGFLVDSSYVGFKNFTCSEPDCQFKISGYSSNCTTQEICDRLRDSYILHHKSNCIEMPVVSVDMADGSEFLFLACKCGFLDFA
jgi:hypothetical protein